MWGGGRDNYDCDCCMYGRFVQGGCFPVPYPPNRRPYPPIGGPFGSCANCGHSRSSHRNSF